MILDVNSIKLKNPTIFNEFVSNVSLAGGGGGSISISTVEGWINLAHVVFMSWLLNNKLTPQKQ